MTERHETQLAIVGAGPAGLAAARAAHRRGLRVVVLDENARAGGQIYRQLPTTFEGPRRDSYEAPSHAVGHALLHEIADQRVTVWNDALVWDARIDKSGPVLFVMHGGAPVELRAERLIIATGAYDRSVPFPGWTLPGVITAGAAQVFVRGQGVVPGRRAVVAGTGPLLLPTVTALLRAGVEVRAILEANPKRGLLRALPGIMANGPRRKEARHYVRHLVMHGLRLRTRHAVFAAHGNGRLERIVFGRIDAEGRPIGGSEREIDVDLLCVGFGLVPSIELGLRLGCASKFDAVRGGWVLKCDAAMQSSIERVFVAGEAAGIGGAEVAMAEGEVSGLAASGATGGEIGSAQRRAARERHRADAMLRCFPVPKGLYDLATQQTIVCRCEDVRLSDLAAAASLHGADVRSVKMGSRAGMGPCQARICHLPIAEMLHHRFAGEEWPPPCPRVQMPLKPVPVQAVVERSP